ncbi:MAG: 4-hydroxyproline epimerase [Opitutales bacterium]
MTSDARSGTVQVVDSHTGGEPTRIVVEGGPDLGDGSLAERRQRFRKEHDDFRTAIVLEPRGSDVLVGGLLCQPAEPDCVAGVIFFNNMGVLNMCGHGTIGLAVTLAHLGRIGKGKHQLDTPVGAVGFEYHGNGEVSLENVSSYRHAKAVTVEVEGHGPVTGDVAWGGNWFFLVEDHGQAIEACNVDHLTDFTLRIRAALEREGITGADSGLIDHIEIFSPTDNPDADSRNFVLCPGGAYDRSPCGTGTSAKLACLIEDGHLAPGQTWRQESVIGSVFEATGRMDGNRVIPTIRGSAHVTAETILHFSDDDPFQLGIRT